MMNVKTTTQILSDKVAAGKMSLREAAVELHKAGFFNFIPSDSQAESYLRKCEEEGRDLEVVTVREQFLNSLSVFLETEKKDSDYIMKGYEYLPHQWKQVKDLEITKEGECRRYSENGETYEVIPFSEIDDVTLAIWNRFIQKHMWNVPGVTMEKIFRVFK